VVEFFLLRGGGQRKKKKSWENACEGFVSTTVAMPPKEGKQRGAVFLLAFPLF